MSSQGWIGVDLDGTLAHYDGWRGIEHIGDPVPAMAERVEQWLREGREVRIFTARCYGPDGAQAAAIVQDWGRLHFGHEFTVTNVKDFGMIELWDDRAVQVEANTGLAYVHPHGLSIEEMDAAIDRAFLKQESGPGPQRHRPINGIACTSDGEPLSPAQARELGAWIRDEIGKDDA